MPTKFQLHVDQWRDCIRCDLSGCRRKVVLARGQVPCDALFVGEAPGESEDVIGQPFVGPAGQLLDDIVAKACQGLSKRPRIAFTNLVCCIPREEDGGKAAEPPDEAIKACVPRLQQFIDLCQPRLFVLVGALAHAWFDLDRPYHTDGAALCKLVHPAAILRANMAQKGLMRQKAAVTLAAALEDL